MLPSAPQGLPWVRCMAHSMLVASTDEIQGCVLSCCTSTWPAQLESYASCPSARRQVHVAKCTPCTRSPCLLAPTHLVATAPQCCCPADLRAAALESRGHWSAHG
jgi:hypothetical protein